MAQLPFLLVLLFLLAVLLRMDLIFYLVYVLGGVYLLSRFWTARSLRTLKVTHNFTDHIFAGETTTVRIAIENGSRLPVPWLRYDESAAPGLGVDGLSEALSLRPRERVELSYVLEGGRRGVYGVGPGRLSTGDLFGLAEMRAEAAAPVRLVVYPRVIPLRHAGLTSRAPHGTVRSQSPLFADPARVVGIRDYARGDPLRSIDWKSSARTGDLQVRKVAPAVSLTAVILLDMNLGAYGRQLRSYASEWAVVVAASVATYLQGERQPVGLGSNGLDALEGRKCWVIPARSGNAHLMTLLEWLARVQLVETTPLVEWLPAATAGLTWGATVVAVTPTGDEATCAGLGRLRQAGLNPVLLAVEPHGQFGRVQQRARQAGVAAHLVADDAGLRGWQSGMAGRAAFTGAGQ